MKNTIILISLFALGTITSSCKKENKAPVIELLEPTNNQVYTSGDEIHMEGTATDDMSLHMGQLSIIRTSDSSILYSYELPNVHDETSYYFHQHYIPTVTSTTALKLYIKFEDHDEALTTKVLDLTVNP